jgi:hemerythrin-like domain-containing protein
MYERHISVEDKTIFPLATRLLSEREKSAIAEEMALRRKVVSPAGNEDVLEH